MPAITYYVAIPFIPDAEGNLSPGEAVEASGMELALKKKPQPTRGVAVAEALQENTKHSLYQRTIPAERDGSQSQEGRVF